LFVSRIPLSHEVGEVIIDFDSGSPIGHWKDDLAFLKGDIIKVTAAPHTGRWQGEFVHPNPDPDLPSRDNRGWFYRDMVDLTWMAD
jgi:hypothetical protein